MAHTLSNTLKHKSVQLDANYFWNAKIRKLNAQGIILHLACLTHAVEYETNGLLSPQELPFIAAKANGNMRDFQMLIDVQLLEWDGDKLAIHDFVEWQGGGFEQEATIMPVIAVTANEDGFCRVTIADEAELERIANRIPTKNRAEWLLQAWCMIQGLNSKRVHMTDSRRAVLQERLKEYPIIDLVYAFIGNRNSAFHQGCNDQRQKYNSIEFILRINRNRNNVEYFRDLALDPPIEQKPHREREHPFDAQIKQAVQRSVITVNKV